jgi:hypothetical protein
MSERVEREREREREEKKKEEKGAECDRLEISAPQLRTTRCTYNL